MMNIEKEIKEAFGISKSIQLTDEFIESNVDIMWIKQEFDHMVYLPSYMLWIVKNGEVNSNLIVDFTINALAEYGKCKNKNIEHLNFKFRCSQIQKAAVLMFLEWCLSNLVMCDDEKVQRSIENWK